MGDRMESMPTEWETCPECGGGHARITCICERGHPEAELPFDPDWVVHPGATLREWREEQGLTVEKAAVRCLLTPTTYELIEAGEMTYGAAVAGRLAYGTGSPMDFWLNRERTFREGLAAGKTWTR
jgi:plasmid maintenance system antidote protein VapI